MRIRGTLASRAVLAAPVPIATFHQPVYVAGVPGRRDTLAVAQRNGVIRLVRRGRKVRRPLADLRRRVIVPGPDETIDQRGLFSFAFAPDYRRTGRLYVDYVDRRDRLRVDVVRHRRVRHVLDLGPAALQHHGGQLQFGPDRRLYVSTGMNDTPAASQDRASPRGKILRVNRGRVTVYALGLRNPWRFSFDRRTGALLIGDVGEHSEEEVDVLPRDAPPGTNFGWPVQEGDLGPDGPFTRPALVHSHSDGWCAIAGGYVRRRRYIYGDLCSGRLWSARLDGTALTDDRPLGITIPYLVSFGQDGRGRVYAVSFLGTVYRVA
jgi:glucose/arabinose dehydrogenase